MTQTRLSTILPALALTVLAPVASAALSPTQISAIEKYLVPNNGLTSGAPCSEATKNLEGCITKLKTLQGVASAKDADLKTFLETKYTWFHATVSPLKPGEWRDGQVSPGLTEFVKGKVGANNKACLTRLSGIVNSPEPKSGGYSKVKFDEKDVYHDTVGSRGKAGGECTYFFVKNASGSEGTIVGLGFHTDGVNTSSKYTLDYINPDWKVASPLDISK